MKLPDIIEVTLEVTKVFEELGIAYHIGGSLASSAFGIARSTLDVDIVADIKIEQVSHIYENLREAFYVDADMMWRAE
jgi:deoxyinosine 3'endonuclease (endonuclease V)